MNIVKGFKVIGFHTAKYKKGSSLLHVSVIHENGCDCTKCTSFTFFEGCGIDIKCCASLRVP